MKNKQNYLLGSRTLDFFLLGGLSLFIWIPLYFFVGSSFEFSNLGLSKPVLIVIIGYVINYPHFMASYKLAYGQGLSFVVKYRFQLIVVPVLMLFLLLVSSIFWSEPSSQASVGHIINDLFLVLKLPLHFPIYQDLGTEILAYLVMFMFFTVGWHYSKQAFGCMMVYAKLDDYPLNLWQRYIIRYALLSIWWISWLHENALPGSWSFFGLSIYRLHIPHFWVMVGYVTSSLLFLGVALVIIDVYLKKHMLPSWNFMIPMITALIWQIPILVQPQFFIFIGFFHALQYLPFVAKVEVMRLKQQYTSHPYKSYLKWVMILIVIQTSVFVLIPNQLDIWLNTETNIGFSVFLIAVAVFINIHHYFIDNVLWRFQEKEASRLLFE